jgi:hypothetical protein
MSQSLILIDVLSSACREAKRKEKRKAGMLFFPGLDMPCWLCHMGFLQLLDAIKG